MSLTKVSYSMITGAVFNVLDYGAKGDGVTDDTAAIESAINAAFAEGHGTVWFPTTTDDYIVTSPIKLQPYVKLQGELYTSGVGSSVNDTPGIRKTTNTTVSITNFDTGVPYSVDCIFYTAFASFSGISFPTGSTVSFFPSRFLIDGLYLKGDGPNLITTGLHMDFGSGLIFTNCNVANTTNGFYGRNVFSSKLEKVIVTGQIKFAQTGTSVEIANCTANAGFYVQGLVYSKMTRCTCDGLTGASAYYFKSCTSFTVDNCGVEGNIPASATKGIFQFDTANHITVISPTIVHATTATTYPCFSIGSFDRIEIIGGDVTLSAANAANAYDIYANTNSSAYFNNTLFVGASLTGGYVQNPIKASVVGSATVAGIVTVDFSEASSSFDENGANLKRMEIKTTSGSPTPTVYNSYTKMFRGLTGSGQFSAGTSASVFFSVAEPNTSYRVSVTPTSDANGNIWVSSKSTAGFFVNSSGSSSATFDWTIVRI